MTLIGRSSLPPWMDEEDIEQNELVRSHVAPIDKQSLLKILVAPQPAPPLLSTNITQAPSPDNFLSCALYRACKHASSSSCLRPIYAVYSVIPRSQYIVLKMQNEQTTNECELWLDLVAPPLLICILHHMHLPVLRFSSPVPFSFLLFPFLLLLLFVYIRIENSYLPTKSVACLEYCYQMASVCLCVCQLVTGAQCFVETRQLLVIPPGCHDNRAGQYLSICDN